MAVIDARIAAKDVRLAGGTRAILRDVRLSLEAGEIVGLLGPSGSGKTTLLRILAGLDPDFSGTVARAPGTRLGIVFQEPRLLPWRTLRQNLALVRPSLDATAIATTLGLGGFLDAYPRQLSLGMARRAAVARALSVRPTLLLLDEPFASLDDASGAVVRTTILERWRVENFAAILVTHDASDVGALAHRSLTLSGSPATLERFPSRVARE